MPTLASKNSEDCTSIIIETGMGEYTNILHSMKLYKLGPEYIPGNTYLGLM